MKKIYAILLAVLFGCMSIFLGATAASATVVPATGPAVISVTLPTATAPSCDAPGSVTPDFTTWAAADNANGYEGDGYHLYISPAYTGPGTYTFTAYRIGGAGNAAYPQGTLFSDGAGGSTKGPLTSTITVLPQVTGIDCVPVPAATHRSTDIFDKTLCDAAGGGTQAETVTNYTSNPVWNDTTQAYDMVETVDADSPVVTSHVITASADQCPAPAAVVTTLSKPDDTVVPATSLNTEALADTGSDISVIWWGVAILGIGLVISITSIIRRKAYIHK